MAFWESLIWFVFTTIVAELIRPKIKIEEARPAGLGDFQFPTATEGRPVQIIWGTVLEKAANVIWYGDKSEVAIREKVKTGLFSSSSILKGYKYYLGVQFGLCHGPDVKLLKIRVKETDIWTGTLSADEDTASIDAPDLLGGDDGTGGIVGTLRWYTGSASQTANSYLSAFQAEAGDTPAYREFCYAVFENGYLGNSENVDPWEFEIQRIPDPLGLGALATVNTYDANPANVIYELYTNTNYGMGIPAGDIDTTSFTTAGTTLEGEGNGFSLILDSQKEISELISEIERQIDGVVVLNKSTGLFTLNLARADYTIGAVPQITEENTIRVESYARGSWEETANEIRVDFLNRTNNYSDSKAFAQDIANQRIQNSIVATTPIKFPGVKTADLANSLAWRELYSYSQPLAKITVVVDRTFWNVNRGDILAFSRESLDNLDQLPVRVSKADFGNIKNDEIVLDLVEDAFAYRTGVFAAPGASGWVPPSATVADIIDANRLLFEAPRAISHRDPVSPDIAGRIWGGFLSIGNSELYYNFEVGGVNVGQVTGALYAGELRNAIVAADHGGNIEVDGSPDTYAELLSVLEDATDSDIGVGLANLIVIGNEFIAFKSFTDMTTYVRLDDCYRGLLDSFPEAHADASRVWLAFVSGGLTDTSFATSPISVKILPQSDSDTLASGSATASSVTIDNRDEKPYPPALLEINSDIYPSTAVNLDDDVSGPEDDGKGLKIEFVRRDFSPNDEVLACLDETNLPSTFPSENTTEYEIEYSDDPDGSDTLLVTDTYDNSNTRYVSRARIYRATAGVIPTDMQVLIKTKHIFSGVPRYAREMFHNFTCGDSDLDTSTNLGNADDNDVVEIWSSAPDTGTYQFDIGSDILSSGNIEARINGGSWVEVIASGLETGTLAGVTATDQVEFRHTQSGTSTLETILMVDPPTTSDRHHAILII